MDHLECTGDDEIEVLLGSDTMPTLLPGSSFFLGLNDPPARKMINAGLPVALASDYNPGSSPSGNMKMIMSLGCIKLRMLPEEVINAVTINSAYAMGLSGTHGSIARGKVANVFITKEIPSYEFMPYAFGSDLIETVILKGEIIKLKYLCLSDQSVVLCVKIFIGTTHRSTEGYKVPQDKSNRYLLMGKKNYRMCSKFSEGRDMEIIRQITDAIESVKVSGC